MRLSAQVSFVASVFLVAGGTAITTIAARKNWRYVPMALMPLFAGPQQFMEGNVWLSMTGDNPFQVLWGALGFIFFTWFMWPIWVPFAMYVIEPPDSPRKPLFLIFSLIGLAFGVLLYVPHGLHPEMVVVEINNLSLAGLIFAVLDSGHACQTREDAVDASVQVATRTRLSWGPVRGVIAAKAMPAANQTPKMLTLEEEAIIIPFSGGTRCSRWTIVPMCSSSR